jgi:hypothetical protein
MSHDEDWYEWPPTKYPARELFTFCCVVVLVLSAVAWLVLGVFSRIL